MAEKAKASSKKVSSERGHSVFKIERTDGQSSSNSSIDYILSLQKVLGNQAVNGLINSGAIKAKFKIGSSGDKYEKEADRVAEQVMLMPDTDVSGMLKTPETIQKARPKISANISTLRGGGQPLPQAVRSYFEPRFGHDFSKVRIHMHNRAGETARAINAQAFTVGNDVVFGPGQFAPQNRSGINLLAHELTHVVQQVPHAARRSKNKNDKPDRCIMVEGLPEGFGYVTKDRYLIWGTKRGNESNAEFGARVFNAWITWRFGKNISPKTRSAIIKAYLIRSYQKPSVQGCQYSIEISRKEISRLVRLVTRMPAAEEAEAREAEAGLPTFAPPKPVSQVGPEESSRTVGEAKEGTVPEEAKTRTSDKSTDQETLKPIPLSGGEFLGGTGTKATHPALRAELTGPDLQPVGGLGTYRMRLDYSIAGTDLLSQVVEAMNWVNYHWERYNITAIAEQGLAAEAANKRRHAAVSEEAEVGKTDAILRRGEIAAGDLAEDVETTFEDLAKTVEHAEAGDIEQAVTNIMANEANLALLPASAIVSMGGWALGALADLMGGEEQEREIPWPKREGVYLLRCIAQPSPQGSDDQMRRMPSVSTKVVKVRHVGKLARAAQGLPEAQIAEKRLELVIELNKTPQNQERVEKLKQELEDLKTAATGSALDAIKVAIRRKNAEIKEATGRRKRQLEDELNQLNKHLQFAETRQQEFPGKIYRPRATLVSRVTGQTYPLLLQLGEMPKKRGRYVYMVSDVTSRDGEKYTAMGNTPDKAVWRTFARFAGQSGYGRGKLAIRLPEDSPFTPREKTLTSKPRGEALVRRRLEDLVTVLAILGIFVPGVGTAVAVIGAAVAAERLLKRLRNDTLRLDAAAISDMISVLGAAAQGVAAVGKVSVIRAGNRFVLAREAKNSTAIRKAVASLGRAQTAAKAGEIVSKVADWGGFVWGNLVTLDQILKINQMEMSGSISHSEARRQRANLLASAVRDTSMQVLSSRRPGRIQEAGVESADPGVKTKPAAPDTPETGKTRVIAPKRTKRSRKTVDDVPEVPKTPKGQTADTKETGKTAPKQPRKVAKIKKTAVKRAPVDEKKRVAHAITEDGLHRITVMDDGRIIRCSSPTCAEIRAHYENFLMEQTDSKQAMNFEKQLALLDIESKVNSKRLKNAIEEGDQEKINALVAEKQQIASDTAQLDGEIRQFAAEVLAPELDIKAERIGNLLAVMTVEQTHAFRTKLGNDLFKHLSGRKDVNVIRQFVRAMQLTEGDNAAQKEVIRALQLTKRGVSEKNFGTALTKFNKFIEQYPGRVAGDFASRFLRAAQKRTDPEQAQAEIDFAIDILEGKTKLGEDLKVEGIPEAGDKPGELKGVAGKSRRKKTEETPEFRITTAGKKPRLAEVKRAGNEDKPLSKETLKRNFKKAISQIIDQSQRTGERGGMVRIDARHTSGTDLTPQEINNAVNGELKVDRNGVKAIDFVDFVEILYRDQFGQPVGLFFKVEDGNLKSLE